jgi:hypothetical protein
MVGGPGFEPEPHGPEPCWLHVLECPGGSADARLNSNCRAFVSVRNLLVPGICAPAVPRRRGLAADSRRSSSLVCEAQLSFRRRRRLGAMSFT